MSRSNSECSERVVALRRGRSRKDRAIRAIKAALAGCAALAIGTLIVGRPVTVAATGNPSAPIFTETRLYEFDITEIVGTIIDGRPGAITVDRGHVWFVTREGVNRVFKLEPPRDLKHGTAPWTSWELDPAEPTGGVKKLKSSWDRRFVFVRTVNSVQKIDTYSNLRTSYTDINESNPFFGGVSDISVDKWNNVYFTSNGFLKRINAGAVHCGAGPCPPADVTQWFVDGGAGECPGFTFVSLTSPCIAGVAVHPKYQNLVYVTESAGNNITEVDTSSKLCYCPTIKSAVKRWHLSDVGASDPRQLGINDDGTVWVITGSGHLVTLDPKYSKMASYVIPGFFNDTFGIAPDGKMIGYTATAPGLIVPEVEEHKVAMLIPRLKPAPVMKHPDTVVRTTDQLEATCQPANRDCGVACPFSRKVNTRISPNNDGTFVEAFINQNVNMAESRESRVPLGITPDLDKSVGTFFYAVGDPVLLTVDRIGIARLPRAAFKSRHEREDKDFDDDGKEREDDEDEDDDGIHNSSDSDRDGDGISNVFDDDNDNDGIPDQYQTKDSRADLVRDEIDLSGGETTDYIVTAGPNTTAVVGVTKASSPATLVSVEILGPSGLPVLPPVVAPGVAAVTIVPLAAGDYTVRVKNLGLTPASHETLLITRQPASLPF